MENVAQTGEYGEWHSRLKISIPVLFVCLFFQMILVHIWAGLGLGWFLSTDQSKEVWTWIKTLFVPDFNTKWILVLFYYRGPCVYVQQPVVL